MSCPSMGSDVRFPLVVHRAVVAAVEHSYADRDFIVRSCLRSFGSL